MLQPAAAVARPSDKSVLLSQRPRRVSVGQRLKKAKFRR